LLFLAELHRYTPIYGINRVTNLEANPDNVTDQWCFDV